jgi:hypothetical protein
MLSNYYYTPRTALSLFCTAAIRWLHAAASVYTLAFKIKCASIYRTKKALRSEQPVGDLVITRAGTLFAPFNSPLFWPD